MVVGGAVRDALLGLEPKDVDWLVADARVAAEDLASRLGGSVFALDEVRGHWRVLTGERTIDLITQQGTLETDLEARDFTINAIALREDGLFDPLGGMRDLAAGELVACSETALLDDPLRGLRGVRFVATLPLSWSDATRDQARRAATAIGNNALPMPAHERMRDELIHVLLAARPGDALLDAHDLGWLALWLPSLVEGEGIRQGGLHHLDVLHHQLEAVQRLATAFPEADVALRLATLLHDVGKPATRTRGPLGRVQFHGHAELGARLAERDLRRLRFDRATIVRVGLLVGWHMIPLPRSGRATRRFVHRRREALPDLLSLMLADREAARGRLATVASRRHYRESVGHILSVLHASPPLEPLLDGETVMALLGLAPGPRVGQALRFVEEARAVGDLTTVAEARDALLAYAEKQGWRESAEPDEARVRTSD